MSDSSRKRCVSRGLTGLSAAAVAVALIAGAWFVALATGRFEISRADLEQRYRLPGARFHRIGQTDYYYVVQGRGPPLVMIPPPYLSLRAYDQLAAALARDHTVVRFDLPGNGLTRMAHERGYSYDSVADDVPALMDHLAIPRAAVLGSSSGAAIAYHLAARHPRRVSRLIIISPSGMPRTAGTNPNRPRGSALHEWVVRHYRSKRFWRDALEQEFTSRVRPSPWLVQMTYDMNRLRRRTHDYYAQRTSYSTGRPDEVLSEVRTPTLILWGAANPVFSPLEAEVAELWLVNAPSLIIKYPGLGLYPSLEATEAVDADVEAFLSGSLDDRLRVTARLPAQPSSLNSRPVDPPAQPTNSPAAAGGPDGPKRIL